MGSGSKILTCFQKIELGNGGTKRLGWGRIRRYKGIEKMLIQYLHTENADETNPT